MKTKWLYGVFTAISLFMCSASYASTYSSDGILAAEPTSVLATYTVDPPLVPAMAPGSTDDGTAGNPCMAACRADRRMSISVNYFKVTDNSIPSTVLACGYQSKSIETPAKIPIAILS